MKPAKKTKPPLPSKEPRFFKCTRGRVHPLKYDDKIIWIGHKEPTELDWARVPHGSKLHIDVALRNKEMIEIKPQVKAKDAPVEAEGE